MPFAAALSEHPVAADAIGEVLGSVLERGGVAPDLAMLFLSSAHAEFSGELSSAVRRVLRPGTLLGAVSGGVVGGARETEDHPGLALWASWAGPARPLRFDADAPGGDQAPTYPQDLADDATVVVLADPFSFPAGDLVEELAESRPDVTVVGGLASGAGAPGGTTLLLDDDRYRDGAVGVALPRQQVVGPLVSQGCRPVGEPMVVTAAEGRYVLELAGRPAISRLEELVEGMGDSERHLLRGGLQLGIVIDESKPSFGRGDFLIRGILGGDREHGVLAIADRLPVGTTVQFHVRDAGSADEDLHAALAGVEGDAALLFTCNGRGRGLFGSDDHDARVTTELLGTDAVAGMSCAGEIGPVAGRSFLHGFTASMLVFVDP